MPKDNSGNDFFKHLEQPAPAPQPRKIRAPGEGVKPVSDHTGKKPSNTRTDKLGGPGLSPGMPVIPKPMTGEQPAVRPRSDVLLTPDGVRRPGTAPVDIPAEPPPEMPPEEPDEFAESRAKNTDESTV